MQFCFFFKTAFHRNKIVLLRRKLIDCEYKPPHPIFDRENTAKYSSTPYPSRKGSNVDSTFQ